MMRRATDFDMPKRPVRNIRRAPKVNDARKAAFGSGRREY